MVHSLKDLFDETQIQAEMLRLLKVMRKQFIKDEFGFYKSDIQPSFNAQGYLEAIDDIIAKAEGK